MTVFKKLFDELPQQLERIEDRLNVGDYENAREITHKLHGSVSFCGLTDIQQPAKKLEQCLLSQNYRTVNRDLLYLKQKVSTFMRYRDRILAGLSDTAIQ
ncbi:MAG: Hpt domain-containing protein [Gammaproteobacteria bacterium]